MFEICKRFVFSASHQLDGLPDGHQCARLHGHNYTVEIELSAARLNRHGFVVDFGDLAPIKQFLDTVFDHRHLNDVFKQLDYDFPTTSEHLAVFLADWCSRMYPSWPVTAVTVSETPATWATYRFPQRAILTFETGARPDD